MGNIVLVVLEASMGGHMLVGNPMRWWCTAIVVHHRWQGVLRGTVSCEDAVWVGLKAEEEMTLCSAPLHSEVERVLERAIEQVLEAGQRRAGEQRRP